MRFRWMVYYWLAAAAAALLCLQLPGMGTALAKGALSFLGLSISGWALFGGFFAYSAYQGTTFGMPNRRLYAVLTGLAIIAAAAGVLAGLAWLAYGAATFAWLCGECIVTDRMLAWREPCLGQGERPRRLVRTLLFCPVPC